MAKEAGITIQLERILSEVSEDENEFLFKCISKAGKQAKRDVVALSPENNGDYKKGWTVRTKRGKTSVESIIYNKDYPGLTHLLEEPHVVRNQYGKYERTNPTREGGRGGKIHIAPAREAAEKYLIELLTRGR